MKLQCPTCKRELKVNPKREACLACGVIDHKTCATCGTTVTLRFPPSLLVLQ